MTKKKNPVTEEAVVIEEAKNANVAESTTVNDRTLELSIRDRLQIPRFMPRNGAYLEMLVGRHIEKKCEISSEEIQEIGLKESPDGQITWISSKEKKKTVELTTTEISFLSKRIDDMSSTGELLYMMMDLAERIKNLEQH